MSKRPASKDDKKNRSEELLDELWADGRREKANAARRRPFNSHASFIQHLRVVDSPHDWLDTLYRVSVSVAREAEPDQLFSNVLDIVFDEVMADRGTVLFRREDESGFRTVAERIGAKVRNPEQLRVEVQPVVEEVAADVMQTGEGVLLTRAALDSMDDAGDASAPEEAISVVAVPFVQDGRVRGMLQLQRRRGTMPFEANDLDLLSGVALQAQVALERIDRRTLRREKARIEEEIRNAEKIQQFFLPKVIPDVPGVEIVWRSFLSHGLGGDYYDLVELEDGRVAMVVGDVSGHSIASALVLSSVRALIRRNCFAALSPAEALGATNDFVKPELPPGMFVTLFLGVLDPSTYTLAYSNAGHNFPLLYSRGKDELTELKRGGLPIGVMRNVSYEEDTVQLDEGDALLLYTDALIEAKDAVGNPFGAASVRELFARLGKGNGHEIVDGLCNRVLNYHLDGPLQDDLTLLVCRIDRLRRNYRFRFPSASTEVTPAAERVARMARELGFVGQRGQAKLRLAMVELIANAVEHGNRYDTATGVTITVSAAPEDLSIKVRDEGPGFDVHRVSKRNLGSMAELVHSRGRGLIIVREMIGMPRYNETGNEVTISIDRTRLQE